MLKISGLFATKENTQILKGINLFLDQNKTYLLLGPNGSGKSTLAKALAGDPSIEISAKELQFLNENILKVGATDRSLKGIFLAHQSPPEISGLNIFSYLHLIFSKHGEKPVPIRDFDVMLNEKLDLLKLSQDIKSRAFNENFSGGERKKMEVLQMLLLKPKLVILDEIDSGVDVDSLKTILEVLENFQKMSGATLLFITHNLNLAKKIVSNEVFVMKNGEIVAKTDNPKEKEILLNLIEEKGYDSI
jgi:Fe-S cluster assembly ATP-binding protein